MQFFRQTVSGFQETGKFWRVKEAQKFVRRNAEYRAIIKHPMIRSDFQFLLAIIALI